jgi:UDP-glucose 4-epimerase
VKHIFISGVAGFLGSHIADAFLKMGYRVSGADNLIGGYVDNVPDGVEFHKIDLLNRESLFSMLEGVDIVYHCACTAYEGLSVFSPALVTENTVQISVNLMVAAIKNKVKKFIHCSSMARYGAVTSNGYTEDMDCRPEDPYGIAKLSAELLLRNLAETHHIDLIIAVPHNIIGPRQKYDDPYRNVASIMINMMLQNRQPIIYGDGKQTRCFSDVDDVTWCLVRMSDEDCHNGEVFNVGPDENPITVLELAEMLAKLLSFPLKPQFFDPRPREVKHAICSSNKIRERFGYKTTIELDQSLVKLIDYIRSRGTRNFLYHLEIEILNELTPKTWTQRLF